MNLIPDLAVVMSVVTMILAEMKFPRVSFLAGGSCLLTMGIYVGWLFIGGSWFLLLPAAFFLAWFICLVLDV